MISMFYLYICGGFVGVCVLLLVGCLSVCVFVLCLVVCNIPWYPPLSLYCHFTVHFVHFVSI